MMYIDVKSPFVLYADCSVVYNGRACSTLERGRYLIIHKLDGTLLIHNANGNPPVNYQGSKATLSFDGSCLISHRKKESITVSINEVIEYHALSNWSVNAAVIRDTEKDLVDKLYDNWDAIIGISVVKKVREFATTHGPIDLVGITSDGLHCIVEVKRGKASLNHCSQLNRYYEHFAANYVRCEARLACPAIGVNALNYLKAHGYTWVHLDFDSRT